MDNHQGPIVVKNTLSLFHVLLRLAGISSHYRASRPAPFVGGQKEMPAPFFRLDYSRTSQERHSVLVNT